MGINRPASSVRERYGILRKNRNGEWNVWSSVELREGAKIPESYINGAYSKNTCSCVELREGARTS